MPSKRRISDGVLRGLIWLSAIITIGFLVLLLVYIFAQGLPHINWEFLTTMYKPGLDQEGILPMIVGTLCLIGLSLLIAVPVGVFAALHLGEYAKKNRFLALIHFATESLAGIPSILYGLFGFTFFVTFCQFKTSILAGSLTMAIMILPLIIRSTEEALQTVPQSYREGSLALGASKLTTLFKIILPSAMPGILAAVILAMGRVVGETAALYYTSGTMPQMPVSAMSSVRSLAIHLYLLAKEGLDQGQAFATACVLIIAIALLNLLSTTIVNHFYKKLNGQKGQKDSAKTKNILGRRSR